MPKTKKSKKKNSLIEKDNINFQGKIHECTGEAV